MTQGVCVLYCGYYGIIIDAVFDEIPTMNGIISITHIHSTGIVAVKVSIK